MGGGAGSILAAGSALGGAGGLLALTSSKKPDRTDSGELFGNEGEKPPQLANRGDMLPWLLGRMRLPIATLGIFDHDEIKDTVGGSSGGKGGGGGGGSEGIEVITHEESGFHGVCIGPAFKLHRIYVNGENILGEDDQAKASGDPSGTIVDETAGGAPRIYWGEINQPIDKDLEEDKDAFDGKVTSRFPFLCYVVWRPLELGEQRNWPSVEIDIEVRPYYVGLAQSSPWVNEKFVENGEEYPIIEVFNADGKTGFKISGPHKQEFKGSNKVRIENNPAAGDYEIAKSVYKTGNDITKVFLETEVEGLTPTGIAKPLIKSQLGGVNPAHGIYQLLFGQWPHGLELDKEDFDIASLEKLGVYFGDDGPEPTPVTMYAPNGMPAREVLERTLVDLGVMVSFIDGQWAFKIIRQPEGLLPTLPSEALLAPLPTREQNHGPRKVSRLHYTFPDKNRNFRKNERTFTDDTVPYNEGLVRNDTVPLYLPIDKPIANRMGNRRSSESFGDGATTKIVANHDARNFYPGMQFEQPDYFANRTLLVLQMRRSTLSARVELDCAVDFLGVQLETLDDEEDADNDFDDPLTDTDIGQDNIATVVMPFPNVGCEKPPKGDKKTLLFARIRPPKGGAQANALISKNQGSWKKIATDGYQTPGGTTVEEIPLVKSDCEQAEDIVFGPAWEFEGLGQDVGKWVDLSGDEEAWREGEQKIIVSSSAGNEIMYVQAFDALGDNRYRMRGVIRCRCGTPKLNHPVGATLFVIVDDQVLVFSHKYVKAGKTIYLKSVPKGLNIDDSKTIVHVVDGLWQKPPDAVNLRVATPYKGRRIYFPDDGSDLVFDWTTLTTDEDLGSGNFPAGEPSQEPPIEGTLRLEIKDDGGSTVRTIEELSELTYTYPYADAVSDFGGALPAEMTLTLVPQLAGVEGNEHSVTFFNGDLL